MHRGSGESTSRLAKAAGAEPSGQMRAEKLHAVVARSTFRSQNVQTPQYRTTFGSCDVEKVHAVVARSTFRSQNVQNTPAPGHFWKLRCRKVHAVAARSTFRSQNVQNIPAPDHFWKLRCRKSARRCGAKHMSKSKCRRHLSIGALLEVEVSKKCTLLWREANFEVNMYKAILGALLEVEMSKKCTPLWREVRSQVKSAKNIGAGIWG